MATMSFAIHQAVRIAGKFGSAVGKMGDGKNDTVSVHFSPNPRVVADYLDKFVMDVIDTQKLHVKIGKFGVKDMKKHYDAKTTPANQTWKPLAASTKERKKRQGKPRATLVETGKLKKMIKYEVESSALKKGSMSDGVISSTRISPERSTASRGVVRARVHQGYGFGTSMKTGPGGRSIIPSRPYIGVSEEFGKYVDDQFQKHLNSKVKTLSKSVAASAKKVGVT